MNDRLYDLLPAIYQLLDQGEGRPLEALLTVLERERMRLADDAALLYANWFIETCSAETIPEIAALLGLSPELERRAAVANTLACRRRKGTLPALERRFADATAWPALGLPRLVPEDGWMGLEVEVWRLPVYPVEDAVPCAVGDNRYTLSPLGVELPLYHRAHASYDLDRQMTLANMPFALGRETPPALRAPLAIHCAGAGGLPIGFADLSVWPEPGRPGMPTRALVDPLSGRFMLEPAPLTPPALSVCYAYALAGDVGGGPYPRTLPEPLQDAPWLGYVRSDAAPEQARQHIFRTLVAALDAFAESPCQGTIRLLDSGTYALPEAPLDTAGWVCPSGPLALRRLTVEAASGESPTLRGTLRIVAGGLPLHLLLDGVWIDGSIVAGGDLTLALRHSTVRPTDNSATASGSAEIAHGIFAADDSQTALTVLLEDSICGIVELPAGSPGLRATRSIVEEIRQTAQTGVNGFPIELEACTVFAPVAFGAAMVLARRSVVSPPAGFFASTRFGDPGYARPAALLADPPVLDGPRAADGVFPAAADRDRLRQAEAALTDCLPDNVPHRLVFRT